MDKRTDEALEVILEFVESEPLDRRLLTLRNWVQRYKSPKANRLVREKLERWLLTSLQTKDGPKNMEGIQEVCTFKPDWKMYGWTPPPGMTRRVLGEFREDPFTPGAYKYWRPGKSDPLPGAPEFWYATKAALATKPLAYPLLNDCVPATPAAVQATEKYNKLVEDAKRDILASNTWDLLLESCQKIEEGAASTRRALEADGSYIYPKDWAHIYRDLSFDKELGEIRKVRDLWPMIEDMLLATSLPERPPEK